MLILNNSYSKITGLSDKDFTELRKLLSYRLDYATARFIPNPYNHVKYLIDRKGNFPTGLLDKVLRFLQSKELDYNVDTRWDWEPCDKVSNRLFKPEKVPTPYPDQLNAKNSIVEARRGVISMPTGTGKSHVIALIVEHTKLKTLIVVPSLELKAQLTESLKNSLTTMEGIVVENIGSTALNRLKDFDCLILDEIHHAAAKTYRDLNKRVWNGIRYRYGLSATPFRNNSEEQLLYESVAGQVVYNLSYAKAVEAGYIVPVDAFYYELPKFLPSGTTYISHYKELVVENEYRNDLIAFLMLKLVNQGVPTLCLVREVAHGEILSNITGLPFVNGLDASSRNYIKLFNSGEIKGLIGTEGVLGEGVDTKPCEAVIIASPGKAKSSFMQKVGRAVRTYPGKENAKIILFKDKSSKYLLKHFQTQVKILREEYLIDPIKLEIE